MRDLDLLPKAHLHLHFTGSMSVPTLVGLAALTHTPLPDQLVDTVALDVPFDKRGWFRFQRMYDVARAVVKGERAMRTVVRQAAVDDAAEGSVRMELQVDPSSYAPHVGGLEAAMEIVLDEARQASAATGVQVAIIVAASRVRHPLEARTLARLAARHAGSGVGEVVGFGLSNDEREGRTADWSGAFAIARKAGLAGVPHGGELLGPAHIRTVLDALHPARLGHGVRAVEDPDTLDLLRDKGIALEVNPTSNIHMGLYHRPADVPLRTLWNSGVQIALGADDPLLFLSRLGDQYRMARDVHGFSDEQVAELARMSLRSSLASESDKARWLAGVDAWLGRPEEGGPNR